VIANYWPPAFRTRYGGGWPSNYLAFDTETTGFSPTNDLIVEWGHVLVQNGEVVDRLGLVIDWTGYPGLPPDVLEHALERVARDMAARGLPYHMTVDRMKAEGMKAAKALPWIRDYLVALQAKDMLFVAHNGIFDERMLTGNFKTHRVAEAFSFGADGLFDTDAVVKASRCMDDFRMVPKVTDTLRSYFNRVKGIRKPGVTSNMGYCYQEYEFFRYGIEPEAMHGAETDAYCVHLLMKALGKHYRESATAGTPPETVLAPVKAKDPLVPVGFVPKVPTPDPLNPPVAAPVVPKPVATKPVPARQPRQRNH
jgi:DNA polymerase III epsilon subunit-like protein